MAVKYKVLIAEDEKPMAKALQLKLSNVGFDVRVAGNGEEALAALEKEQFDIMLLDLVMPKLDGFGTLQAIAAKKIKVPVIITSNLSQEEDKARTRELGAVDYIVKSDTPINQIVETVKKHLKM
ncbi:MAG: hypothetical protein C3F02_00820 [Parcubacteria group bacterium]|nr:MAG: hypothetical protein C3F02_00820 [Parcubacteria group bacterium]